MDTFKAILAVFGTLVVVAIVVLAGWQIGWWFKGENLERQVNLDNRNLGTQTAWADEALDSVAEYYTVDESNTAARGALRRQACELIGRLDDDYLTPDLSEFYVINC